MFLLLNFTVFIIIAVAFMQLILVIDAQNIIKTLNQNLFANYDAHTRPVKYASNITDICVGLYLLQIGGVKERSQVMQANIQFVFIWNDAFLKWDPNDYENITAIQVRSHTIWTPDIIIVNSADQHLMRDNRDNFLLRVTNTGTVRWQYQTLSNSFCQIDIMKFPFDEQICYINVRSSARDKHMLHLMQRNLKVKVKENIRTEWFVVDSIVENTTLVLVKQYLASEYVVLTFKLRIRRVITYYIFKIIIPFSMIAFTTLFAFWLAPDSGEKITLEVTILLSLVIYLQYISEYIPRSTTGLPMLTVFTLANFFLVFLSCVMTVFVLRMYYPSTTLASKIRPIPNTLRVFLFKYVATVLCYTSHHDICSSNQQEQEKVNNHEKIATFINHSFHNYHEQKLLFKKISENKNLKTRANSCASPMTTTTSSTINRRNEELAKHILTTLKSLKKIIINKNDNSKHTDDGKGSTTSAVIELQKTLENNIYNSSLLLSSSILKINSNSNSNNNGINDNSSKIHKEEWKQAALILDRLFFYLFLIIMPLTITVFFKTNVFEYIISSNIKRDDNVPNRC